MERGVLSRDLVCGEDAAVLRGAVQQHGEQLFIPDDSEREDDCALGGGDAGAFKFSFKAPQRVTHLRSCATAAGRSACSAMRLFRSGETRRGAVPASADVQKGCGVAGFVSPRIAGGNACAFEFRHESWFDDEVSGCLRKHRAAAVHRGERGAEDSAGGHGGFRLLAAASRNYSRRDLARWADFVRSQSGWCEAFVYFKHEETGAGPKFAQQFQKLSDA